MEAEITASDIANQRLRLKAAGFPVHKTLEAFKVTASSVPQATLDDLASLEWVRAAENLVLWARPAPGSPICWSRSATLPSRPATGSATSPPPSWSRRSTRAGRQLGGRVLDRLLRNDLNERLAVRLALWNGVVQLVGWGIDVGRRRGRAWPAALLAGLVNGAFGLVIILLEVLLH